MTIEEFVTTVVGNTIVVTGPDRGECTAIAHKFEKDLGLPIVYGHAVDTFANAPVGLYEKTIYKPGLIPPPGAIMVWGKPFGKITKVKLDGSTEVWYAGHTAVVELATPQFVQVIGQNDPPGSPAQVRKYAYTDAMKGWFTPKVLLEDQVLEGRTIEEWAALAKDGELWKQAVVASKAFARGMDRKRENVTLIIDDLQDYKDRVEASPAKQKLEDIKKLLEQ